MADGTELDRLYYTVDVDYTPAMQKLKGLDGAAGDTGEKLTKHFKAAGDGAERMGRGIELSRREALYFGRELATGDLARLPSTFVLIASHMAGLTTAGILMGGAIAAPFALMATALYQAEKAQERVRMAIAATGGAAGVTGSQVIDMANKIGAAGGDLSTRGALDASAKLLAHGNISGRVLPSALGATEGYAKMTGLDSDKAAEALEKLLADPGKGAKELNEQFKLLDGATTRRIMAETNLDTAQEMLAKAIHDRGQDVEKSMWSLSQGFDKLATWASNFWYQTGGAPLSDKDQMASYAAQMKHEVSIHARPRVIAPIAQEMSDLGNKMKQDGIKAAADKAAADKKHADDLAHSPGALDIQKYKDEVTIARAPIRDRDMLRAQLDAKREFTANANNPDMAPFAAGIEEGQKKAAAAKIAGERADALKLTKDSAEAEERLASAYRLTAAAGLAMESSNKAQAEFDKGTINNKKEEIALLDRQAAAARLVSAEKEDIKSSGDVASLRLENSLMGANQDLRERKLAELKAENDLVNQGFEGKALADELAARLKITDAMEEQTRIHRELQYTQDNELSVARDATSMVGDIFDHANEGAKGLKTLLPDITQKILQMVEKLAILNPLENMMTGNITGTKGHLPTTADVAPTLAKMFGGGGSGGKGGGIGAFVSGLFGHKAVAGGPGGTMGVPGGPGGAQPAPVIHQYLSVHPDVSAIAKGEIVKAMPAIQASAFGAFSNMMARGATPGGIGA